MNSKSLNLRLKTLARLFPGIGLAAAILALVSVPSARAEVVYTYTGNPFTSNRTGNPAVTNLTVTLDFSTALPANLTFGTYTTDLDSWSISDGYDTLTSASDSIYFFQIGTSGGSISNWNLGFENNPYPLLTTQYYIDQSLGYGGGSLYSDDVAALPGAVASNKNDAGTWSETTTPEPGTALLAFAGTALVASFCTVKSRLRRLTAQKIV